MQTRPNFIRLATSGILLAGLLLALLAVEKTGAQDDMPRPLLDASIDEVREAALRYTYNRFEVVSGEPQVLLIRPVTEKELPELGLPAVDFETDPPLMLVVIKGDLNVSNIRGAVGLKQPWFTNYVAYVIDLNVGAPAYISVSPNGEMFRTLLNDQTLPADSAIIK